MFDKYALEVKRREAALNDFIKANKLSKFNDRTQVFGYNRSVASKAAQAQRFNDIINGTLTSDKIVVNATVHLYAQARERGISAIAIIDSLMFPLDVRMEKSDSTGRISKQYIGEKATTAVNPTTGNAISCWKTGKRILKKYKGGS